MHTNKLKGQPSIPSALQQTICCSLNDSCLAQERTWLPLCDTHVCCCWHSSSAPSSTPPGHPTPGQPVPCPGTSPAVLGRQRSGVTAELP